MVGAKTDGRLNNHMGIYKWIPISSSFQSIRFLVSFEDALSCFGFD